MYTEVLTLNGTPFNIWYESLEDRQKAIAQARSQPVYVTQTQTSGCSSCGSRDKGVLSLQANLIQNPGFETNCGSVPCNWWNDMNPVATYTYPAIGHSGNGVSVSLPSAAKGYWAQTLAAVSPSTTYTLSGFISTSNVAGTGAFLEIDFFDSVGTYITNSARTGTLITGTTSWANSSFTVTSPSNAASAVIALVLSGSGSASFDDISLTGGGGGGGCGACSPSCPTGTCQSGYVCSGGTCVPSGGGGCGACSPSCLTGTCPTGYVCSGGTCVPTGGGGGGGGGCTNCDLTNNYCLAGTCLPKKYVVYAGVGFGAVFLLSVLK